MREVKFLFILIINLLLISPSFCSLRSDIDFSGKVDFNDFSIMAEEWLKEAEPAEEARGFYVIAPENASVSEKQWADYVCDGIDDQVEIQRAFDGINDYMKAATKNRGGRVLLLEGEYRISSTIYLPETVWFQGQGVNSTKVRLVPNANCDLLKYDNAYYGERNGYMIVIEAMSLNGRGEFQSSGPSRCLVTGFTKDLFIKNVFFEDARDEGFVSFHSWGMNITESLVEWCGGSGYVFNCLGYKADSNAQNLGDFRVGDTVTQATTGGKATVTWIDDGRDLDSDGTAVQLMLTDRDDNFDESQTYDIINDRSSDVFSPSTQWQAPSGQPPGSTQGPKISNNKFQACGEDQLVIKDYVYNTLLVNCETAAAEGTYAVRMEGDNCRGNIISNTRFQYLENSNANGYIRLTDGTKYNYFYGNYFAMSLSASNCPPAIDLAEDGCVRGNVISNNLFTLAEDSDDYELFKSMWWFPCNIWKDNFVRHKDGADKTGAYKSIRMRPASVTWQDYFANDCIYDNSRFTGAIEITLPATEVGYKTSWHIKTAQFLKLQPNSGDIIHWSGADITDADFLKSNTVGSYLILECFKSGEWQATLEVGTWAKE